MTTEWAMVRITAVYVVATIFICWANIRSANAAKAQLKEMQRQYAETNRPLIELEFDYIRRMWYVVRFINHGNITAQHVRINLEQGFIDSLPEESFRNDIEKLKGKKCIVGVGQHYDLFIGSNKLRGNPQMRPLIGTVEYEAKGQHYQSDIFVDLEHYMTFFSVSTEEEDLLKSVNKISTEIKNMQQALLAQNAQKEPNDLSNENV